MILRTMRSYVVIAMSRFMGRIGLLASTSVWLFLTEVHLVGIWRGQGKLMRENWGAGSRIRIGAYLRNQIHEKCSSNVRGFIGGDHHGERSLAGRKCSAWHFEWSASI
jgi:hypothetical protein